jgi:putative endonuclease
MFYVYAIKSMLVDYIYVGMTNNIERRLEQHNRGQNRSTKAYKPFILIFSEQIEGRDIARKREKYLKRGIGKEYLKSISK